MLINEAGVVRAIKRAYKGGGYTVNSQGGVMSIYTQSWYIPVSYTHLRAHET